MSPAADVDSMVCVLAGQKALQRLILAHRDEYERYTAEELRRYRAVIEGEPSLFDYADVADTQDVKVRGGAL